MKFLFSFGLWMFLCGLVFGEVSLVEWGRRLGDEGAAGDVAERKLIEAGAAGMAVVEPLLFGDDAVVRRRAGNVKRFTQYGLSLKMSEDLRQRVIGYVVLDDRGKRKTEQELKRDKYVWTMALLVMRMENQEDGEKIVNRLMVDLKRGVVADVGALSLFDPELLNDDLAAFCLNHYGEKYEGEARELLERWRKVRKGLAKGLRWKMLAEEFKLMATEGRGLEVLKLVDGVEVDRDLAGLRFAVKHFEKETGLWDLTKLSDEDALRYLRVMVGGYGVQSGEEGYLDVLARRPGIELLVSGGLRQFEVMRQFKSGDEKGALALALKMISDGDDLEGALGILGKEIGDQVEDDHVVFKKGFPELVVGVGKHESLERFFANAFPVRMRSEAAWRQKVGGVLVGALKASDDADGWLELFRLNGQDESYVRGMAAFGKLGDALSKAKYPGEIQEVAFIVAEQPGLAEQLVVDGLKMENLRIFLANMLMSRGADFDPAFEMGWTLTKRWRGQAVDLMKDKKTMGAYQAMELWEKGERREAIQLVADAVNVHVSFNGSGVLRYFFMRLEPSEVAGVFGRVNVPTKMLEGMLSKLQSDGVLRVAQSRFVCQLAAEYRTRGDKSTSWILSGRKHRKDALELWKVGEEALAIELLENCYWMGSFTSVAHLGEIAVLLKAMGQLDEVLSGAEKYEDLVEHFDVRKAVLMLVKGDVQAGEKLMAGVKVERGDQFLAEWSGGDLLDMGKDRLAKLWVAYLKEGEAGLRDGLTNEDPRWMCELAGKVSLGIEVRKEDRNAGFRIDEWLHDRAADALLIEVLEGELRVSVMDGDGVSMRTMEAYFSDVDRIGSKDEAMNLLRKLWGQKRNKNYMSGAEGTEVWRHKLMVICGMMDLGEAEEAYGYFAKFDVMFPTWEKDLSYYDKLLLARGLFGERLMYGYAPFVKLVALEDVEWVGLKGWVALSWRLRAEGGLQELLDGVRRHRGEFEGKELRVLVGSLLRISGGDLKALDGAGWLDRVVLGDRLELGNGGMRLPVNFAKREWETLEKHGGFVDPKAGDACKVDPVIERALKLWKSGEKNEAKALLKRMLVRLLLDEESSKVGERGKVRQGNQTGYANWDQFSLALMLFDFKDAPLELVEDVIDGLVMANSSSDFRERCVAASRYLLRKGRGREALMYYQRAVATKLKEGYGIDVGDLVGCEAVAAYEGGDLVKMRECLERELKLAPYENGVRGYLLGELVKGGERDEVEWLVGLVDGFWGERVGEMPKFKPFLLGKGNWEKVRDGGVGE